MWATAWPNGQGWDVGQNAEVVKQKNGLGVRIITADGKIKTLFIPDLSLDPVSAVRRCWKEGKFEMSTRRSAACRGGRGQPCFLGHWFF